MKHNSKLMILVAIALSLLATVNIFASGKVEIKTFSTKGIDDAAAIKRCAEKYNISNDEAKKLRDYIINDEVLRLLGCPYCQGGLSPHKEGRELIASNEEPCKHNHRYGYDKVETYSCYRVRKCTRCRYEFPETWTEDVVTCYGRDYPKK